MTTDIQKSFSATLTLPGRALNFLGTLYEQPAISHPTMGSGGFFSGHVQARNDSSFLGSRPNSDVGTIAQLDLYFWYTAAGYEVYILDNGPRLPTLRLSRNTHNILAAVDRNKSQLTAFDLLDRDGNVVTLDNLTGNHHLIKIKTRGGGFIGRMKVRGSPFSYIADINSDVAEVFDLTIFDTHLPSRPDA